METPVFLFNGFLDSGKTTFIQDTISDKDFLAGEKTLLIACEEGECVYDAQELLKEGIVLEMVEDEEDFTPEFCRAVRKSTRHRRYSLSTMVCGVGRRYMV